MSSVLLIGCKSEVPNPRWIIAKVIHRTQKKMLDKQRIIKGYQRRIARWKRCTESEVCKKGRCVFMPSPSRTLSQNLFIFTHWKLHGLALLQFYKEGYYYRRVGSHSLLQRIFLHSGIEPVSPALQEDSLPSEPPGKPNYIAKID